MLDLSSARKNRVNLADYDCQRDIENRILMSDFSVFDHTVLEEILFCSLKFSRGKLARGLDCAETDLVSILDKLAKTGLLQLDNDEVSVDKEMRKYFEFQINRFAPEFKPDMEYLQGLLRKVPIHILPNWYAVPRTSNNIFESIVEKYLLSPQIFQRHLVELGFTDPIVHGIISDVFSAPDFSVSSSELIAKYNLSRHQFEEILVLLEFNFVCCVAYLKEDDHWVEMVTPFHEWHEYLRFLKKTETPILPDPKKIECEDPTDFSFIRALSELLLRFKKSPLPLSDSYSIRKLQLVHLLEEIDGLLHPTHMADEWLEMSDENKALFFYRHPDNRILSSEISPAVATERHIREAEKSIKRVLHGKWVFFDLFLQGVLVPLSEESVISLKRSGKHWKYHLPTYTQEEKDLIQATLFDWLFEAGVIYKGVCEGRPCFAVTPFGRFFFED